MIIKQLSVFLENSAGRFLELSKVLGNAEINISALSLAENAEFGIARMIVSDTDKAATVLRENEFSVNTTDVLHVEMPDTPGALSHALAKLADAYINVSYIYGYSKGGTAYLIMKVADPVKAESLLSA